MSTTFDVSNTLHSLHIAPNWSLDARLVSLPIAEIEGLATTTNRTASSKIFAGHRLPFVVKTNEPSQKFGHVLLHPASLWQPELASGRYTHILCWEIDNNLGERELTNLNTICRRNYSPLPKQNAGNSPLKSNFNASVALTPCLRQVER